MTLDPDQRRQRSARLADLLARTALSDQQAFAELYRLTSPHLYAVALRILRVSGPAEEVLQESYVNIWHHAGSYVAAKSQPLTWMTSIVRNRCLDQMRRREVDTVAIDDEDPGMMLADDRPSPIDLLLSSADALAVRSCVERLEAGQKQAIALAFYQGLSHSELASHLRQPLGTVKSWVRRGLEHLKACLDGAGLKR
jgi:RNA polymerase sigma factor (sigma-70 family)